MLILVLSLACSIAAIASERYVLTATEGSDVIIRIYELDHNQIKMRQSKVIQVNSMYGIIATAVTFRNENNTVNFDVYYSVCKDIECAGVKPSMTRVDSNLNVMFQKDFAIETAYGVPDLDTERVQTNSGISLRLMIRDDQRKSVERKLQSDGNLGPPSDIGLLGDYTFTAAEDGKVLAGTAGPRGDIRVRAIHPDGPINVLHVQDLISSLAVTGPIGLDSHSQSAGSFALSKRFLFFRAWRIFGSDLKSGVMMQKIDNTGKFIGVPKIFTQFKIGSDAIFPGFYTLQRTVTVVPDGNIVFFTEWDTSCNKNALKAQVLNPQSGAKVGPSQSIISCSDLQPGGGIFGIDVTKFNRN